MTAADAHYRFKESPFSSHSKMMGMIGSGNTRTVIDAGCASGFLAERMSADHWRVIGIEPDRIAASAASTRCERLILSDLVDVDFEQLVPYDVVIFGDVLEHLVNPQDVLARAAANLSNDGFIIVSIPNVAHVVVRLGLLLGRFNYTDRGILDRTHLRFFTRRTFLGLVRDSGLVVCEFSTTPAPMEEVFPALEGRWLRWILGITDVVARVWPTLFGYQFVAKLRKP